MEMRVVKVAASKAATLKNLYTLYLYDLSEYDGAFINENGTCEPMHPVDAKRGIEIIWEKPAEYVSFLFLLDDKPIGFAIIVL